jgi:hypothetical protein
MENGERAQNSFDVDLAEKIKVVRLPHRLLLLPFLLPVEKMMLERLLTLHG